MDSRFQLVTVTALLALIMILGAFSFRLWIANRELSVRPNLPPIIYRQAIIQNSFLNSDGLASYSNQNVFSDEKKGLIEEKKSFIEVDLQKMLLTLYKDGEAKEEFPVLSKGREGSWWETPTGRYKALAKEVNHFSSIGKVWMPWSIQFYGNFFIHGWPYHQNGEPVPKSYSGGCVRLSSEDAEKVFSFVAEGMPIILLDSNSGPVFRSEIQPSSPEIGAPAISAKAVLISDLDTGEIILDKNSGDILPIASLTKLMTATVASELIYLGRSVLIDTTIIRDPIQSYPLKTGERIQAFDLLYPLLMESSNGAARALAAFMGERYFLSQMKAKAMTLSMKDTDFEDPAGIGDGNISSLKDMAKLSKYIIEKRRFIFEVGKGEDFQFFGINTLSGIKNYNEFAGEENLIGMKNGETEAAGQTILTVWKMKDRRGDSRIIFIGILGSGDRARDVEAARAWLKRVFGLGDD